jgi:hypothetical protein
MSNLYRGPSNDASNQALIHLPRRFQRRRCFRNQPIKNKNGLWWPCLLTDRDEINNLYKGPSIVSVHLAKRLQRRRFLKIGLSENCNLNLITVGKLNTEVNLFFLTNNYFKWTKCFISFIFTTERVFYNSHLYSLYVGSLLQLCSFCFTANVLKNIMDNFDNA